MIPHCLSVLPSFCASVCLYVFVLRCGVVQGIQYYDYVVCLRFYMDIFVDLVKCSVLTLVGEIQCYRNDGSSSFLGGSKK